MLVNESLNIREGSGTSYRKLASIPKGKKVDVLGNVSNGWVKVRYENVTGYVSAKLGQAPTVPAMRRNVMIGCLTMLATYVIGQLFSI